MRILNSYAGRVIAVGVSICLFCNSLPGQTKSQTLPIWPELAPGETSLSVGEALPKRPNEKPPISRIVNVKRPTLDVFLADNPNGTGVLVLPGGGFAKVVPDLEGSEIAPVLNRIGISVFVLNYRTSEGIPDDEPLWKRPLQDAQRGVRMLHANAKKWKLDPERIGVVAFSAGGQVGAILHTRFQPAYQPLDSTDEQTFRPAFSILIYPWRILDSSTGSLIKPIHVTKDCGPAFIVHTHDDQSSAVGSALLYIALKQAGVPAELHIYQNGGHGYGLRPRIGSVIGSWSDRAVEWLQIRGLGSKPHLDRK